MRRLVWVVLMVSALAFAQERDFSKVEVKTQKVADGVYMLTGAGGNIGVSAGEDGIVIIDDQFAPLAPKIQAALKGIVDKPVRFVLNTHYHGDHVGGNEPFAQSGSTVVAHEKVRKRMAAGTEIKRFGKAPPAPKDALPIVTFSDSLSIHVNGEDIRAIHFPAGHTDGDSVIYFTKANVVHMGDDFVTYGFPFVDIENGGSVSGLIAGGEKVLATVPADAKFIPGHGPLSTAQDLRKFVQMMKDTRAAVAAAVAKKQTLEQIKAANVLAQWEDLGKGFIKTNDWVEVLYADVLSAKDTKQRYKAHGHTGEKPKP